MTEFFGYIAAILVGLTLGLLGGGGSILTVPVLVYLIGINPIKATAYSLFIVGLSALVGSSRYFRKGLLNYPTAIIYGIPSLSAVFLTRMFLIPAIPELLFSSDSIVITKDIGIMLFFSLVMLIASYSMITAKEKVEKPLGGITYNYPLIFAAGAVEGMVTGIVGAGGGFLIVPALVLIIHLPIKLAVGTSLLIIAEKSLIGFLGDLHNMPVDWYFLLSFSGMTVVGIYIGTYLNQFVPALKLKRAFGWFVLSMGLYIIWREIFLI